MWQTISSLGEINWAALNDPVMIARLILQVFLFLGSALFSMSETALFSLRESDLQRLEKTTSSKAQQLRNLLDEPRQLIISILCGNELINIAATVNLAGIFLALYADPATVVVANTLVMLPLLLLFGEVTPKTAAVQQPVLLCTKLIGPVITYWIKIVAPLRAVIHFIADYVTTKVVGEATDNNHILGVDEFETFLSDVEESGTVNPAERQLIVNLIEAGSKDVKQIMVPHPLVCFIDADLPVQEIIDEFSTMRHRRVPVYRGQRDNIIGILYDTQVIKMLDEKSMDELNIEALLQPVKFIPDTMTISHVAELFNDKHHHAVMVINEFGGIEGLVAADDVFGYFVHGHSTYLRWQSDVQEVSEDEFECHGLTSIEALHHATNIAIDDLPVSTVGGFLMYIGRRQPTVGDVIETDNWIFTVERMDGLLIERVRITARQKVTEVLL
ncbi:MAG: hypothetical protein CSA45_00125 [Gammaproteobacteria bacterium]|nr:MAG: hypothetical protein CSA45_00125 [Gammaproteobacteria bacterium]